jgi:rsbT antagonist protein RsbS
MPKARDSLAPEPLLVSILRQGAYLIASIHTALDDSQLLRFRQNLVDQIGLTRSTGVIIDVAALDVLDSFATHTLQEIGEIARLRGARTVVVGINPEVAYAMVCLGIQLRGMEIALDLDEGLAALDSVTARQRGLKPRRDLSRR